MAHSRYWENARGVKFGLCLEKGEAGGSLNCSGNDGELEGDSGVISDWGDVRTVDKFPW